MSILIKGLDMPKDYWYLDLVITSDGVVRFYGDEEEVQIAEAVELPDHGDLIDRDAVEEDIFECHDTDIFGSDYIHYCLRDAPVVIPAERSEDGNSPKNNG